MEKRRGPRLPGASTGPAGGRSARGGQWAEVLDGGSYIRISDGPHVTPRQLMYLALTMSSNLGGRPVLCSEFLPGVSIYVEARLAGSSAEAVEQLAHFWRGAGPRLQRWVEKAEQSPRLKVSRQATELVATLDRRAIPAPGDVLIEVVRFWGARP